MLIHSSKPLPGQSHYVPSPTEADESDNERLTVGGLRPSPPGHVPEIDDLPEELFAFAAGLSAAVYRPLSVRAPFRWPGVEDPLMKDGATRLATFEEEGLQAAAFVLDERAWIAFRGTDPMEVSDWIFDFSVLPCYHVGFRRAWLALQSGILDWAATVGPEVKSFALTGHSLGGALATLAAGTFADHDMGWLEAVITFGSPRVGSPWFTQHYNRQSAGDPAGSLTLGAVTWRIHNRSDVVTYLPPSFIGFKHAGQSLPISELPAREPPDGRYPADPYASKGFLSGLADHYKSTRSLRPSLGSNPLELYIDFLFWIGERPHEHMMRLYGQAFGDTLSFSALSPEPEWMKQSPTWWEKAIVGTAVVVVTGILVVIPYLLFHWATPSGRAFMIAGLALTILYILIDYSYRPALDRSRRETLFGA